MTPLSKQDLLPYAEYELARPTIRQNIIALKKRRRISVGPYITLVFENRETLLFQIQEMIRTERIFEPDKVQEELDVYNAILPADGHLSATLFIEITQEEDIQKRLDTFYNIDQPGTVLIQVDNHTVDAKFEAGHSKEDKISAVHFVQFAPSSAWIAALSTLTSVVSMVINHEQYQERQKAPEALRSEWLADLQGNTA